MSRSAGVVLCAATVVWASVVVTTGTAQGPAARELKNPVPADEQALTMGKALYQRFCAGCHGEAGRGDGTIGEGLDPRPADLTDAKWTHGSTDGEIYTVIRDGAGTGMRPFRGKMADRAMWQIVHYVRSLEAKPATRQ